ncbi:hypothetical protein BKA70DRAFT_1408149 [Coprinopsis sp. MPI-PUGE-AT-0042]|nr:hypothetical protein BKA70DRAFT_1408149 [Coprinopsis sp. MPI-PUGE-AT-0042]
MQLKGTSSSTAEDDFELVNAEDARIPAAPRTRRADPGTLRSRHDFKLLVECLQRTADSHRPFNKPIFHAQLFPSDSNTNLYQFFLDNIAPEVQQEHCCHACRSFLQKYGDLCVVSEATGALVPLFWPEKRGSVPAMYQKAVEAVRDLFHDKEVASDYHIFVERHRHLGVGQPTKPTWYHFNVILTLAPIGKPPHGLLDFDTAYTMLLRVLEENSIQVINTAHHLLHEKLPHSTSHKPSIEWLQTIATKYHKMQSNTVGARNFVHHHARDAWIGLLPSLRSGVIGELLASIREGLQYRDIEARWVSLANPTAYLRPTAAPSAGNISVAEKKLQMLGYTKDDLMRYQTATDELPASAILWKNDKLWFRRSAKQAPQEGSIFGGIKPATKTPKVDEAKGDGAPPTSISFRKFAQRILPTATSVEILLKEKTTATFFTRGAEGR